MALKRKISIRKILQVLLTAAATTCCVIAIISASGIEGAKTLKRVDIHFKNDKKYHFIQEQEIMDLAITNRHIDVEHIPLSKLDIHSMEQLIMADPWVASAQVYVDNERILHMFVTQRIPVVRLFDTAGRSFYLDTTLSAMPLSTNYIYYTTVVTNVPELRSDSAGRALKKDIVTLVRTIQADTFWNTQISQVIVDSGNTFELVPILGDHRIIFGDVTRAKEKLHNLFVFYKNVLNRIGWDKYQTLDVRFNGQVVASPSLPYTGPVDKAVTNMNWINSIVETEARNDARDSVAEVVKAPVVQPVVKPAAAPPKNAKKIDKKKLVIKGKKQKQDAKKKKNHPKYVYPEKKNH